jgi:hypothetical protein
MQRAATADMTPKEIEAPGPNGALRGTLLSADALWQPMVLIIPGSGPTDRDGNNPMGVRAATYRLLAEDLAARGIASLRIDKRGLFGSAAAFPDPNFEPEALARFGADVEAVRRRLHAVDAAGALHVGADCAVGIWLRTPGEAWLGRIVGLPGLIQIARFAYDRFADLLYAWNRRNGRW